MPDQSERKRRHFILEGFALTERFSPPRLRMEKTSIPEGDRRPHGDALLGQIATLKPVLETARRMQTG